MIVVPDRFKPKINTTYPPNNFIEYERWVGENFISCNTDRVYLPVYWCGYQVNHNYGNDIAAMKDLQDYIDSLPRDKKYWTISQYDDGVGVDFKDLDVFQFNMSKNVGVQIPLLAQPHPYTFTGGKKIFASFIGNKTHPIREHLEKLKGRDGYYISFEQHSPEEYCRIMHQSMFALCPRGYGLNSFRIMEAMQYNAIPVYISDEFIFPYEYDFNYFGVTIEEKDARIIEELLASIDPFDVIQKQERIKKVYRNYYTYEGNLNIIQLRLEAEYHNREKPGTDAPIAK